MSFPESALLKRFNKGRMFQYRNVEPIILVKLLKQRDQEFIGLVLKI